MSPLASILLVDNDQTATFLHQRMLRRLQVAEQLVAVANGAEALGYLPP
jgi:CheY-like chemotaxis protein